MMDRRENGSAASAVVKFAIAHSTAVLTSVRRNVILRTHILLIALGHPMWLSAAPVARLRCLTSLASFLALLVKILSPIAWSHVGRCSRVAIHATNCATRGPAELVYAKSQFNVDVVATPLPVFVTKAIFSLPSVSASVRQPCIVVATHVQSAAALENKRLLSVRPYARSSNLTFALSTRTLKQNIFARGCAIER